MKKKKKYFMGRKHKQFYVSFNQKSGDYEIKPIPDEEDVWKVWKHLADEMYIYQGSYAECTAFKKGYDLGYSTFKHYYKSRFDTLLKDISKSIFDHDIKMTEVQ